jgi:hypothetical protein
MKASTGFQTYSLALIACALACKIIAAIAGLRPAPADPARPYRAAVDRLIADAMPPGWTVRRGLYITSLADPRGDERAFTYSRPAENGHPLLVATRITTTRHLPPPTVWDLTDPRSPDNFRAWLAEITGAPTGGAATGSAAAERPSTQ